MNLMEYFDAPFCIRLAVSLAHFIWQGLVIALLALVLVKLIGRDSSRARYSLYMMSLVAMVLCLGVTYAFVDAPATPTPSETESVRVNAPSVSTREALATEESPRGLPEYEPLSVGEQDPGLAVGPEARFSGDWQRFVPYAIVFYSLGVLILLGRLLIGLQGGQRLRKSSIAVQDVRIPAILTRQARALGMSFTPPIACCQQVLVPTVVGILRPIILLPFSFATGLRAEQIEMLLAHELAHIRRYDPLLNVIQRIIEAVLFFHPAVWFVSHRIRIERENCCDDLVLATGGTATAYASSLVEIAHQTLIATSRNRLAI